MTLIQFFTSHCLYAQQGMVGLYRLYLVPLPADHIEFYKKTVVRLVGGKELPALAMNQFDSTFVIAV